MSDVLDSKIKSYAHKRNVLALMEPVILLVLLAAIQTSGLSLMLKEISFKLSSSVYGAIMAYAIFFGIIYYLSTFYLHFYGSYILEHKFGLSNQKVSAWIKDESKRASLSLILFLLFIEALYFFLYNATPMWWFFMALGWVMITILLVKIAPILIIPLFFKYEILKDEELKKRLMHLAIRCGIRILDIFRLVLSEKTEKANAALVGIGKTRRILLGDTLLEKYTKDEIEVVMAHELAHHKLAHMPKLISLNALAIFMAFYIVEVLSGTIANFANIKGIGDISLFPSIIFIFLSVTLIISPLQNAYSRKLESSADLFALRLTNMPLEFISCMKKLSRQNLSDPSPSRFIEIMLYDHPPISKRIEMAQKQREEDYGKEKDWNKKDSE